MNLLKPIILAFFWVGFNSSPVFSQENTPADVASYAANFNRSFENVATLTEQLTSPFQTELDKAGVIFYWIAHNIAYDCKKFHQPKKPSKTTHHNISARTMEELERKIEASIKELNEKTAKNKKGICFDYSQLYKAMCDYAGLEAVVITGDARDFHRPYRKEHNNPHAWNAVKIDGQWYLLDATWAAGYTDGEVSKFTRYLSPGFFKTPPAWFVTNHFPNDPKWQLLEQPLAKAAFAKQPMINYGQAEFPIEDFSSEINNLQGSGFNREFRIKFKNAPPFFSLASVKSNPVAFTYRVEDGWHVFSFSGRGISDVTLYGGNLERGKKGWLAKYDIR